MAVRDGVLGHVVFNVADVRVSEAFYRSILGMKVSGRNPRTKMSFLSFGREHHDIALMEIPAGAKQKAGDGLPGLHHFCIYVKSPKEVDDVHLLLKKKNVRIVSGPEILEVARNRSISFLDPDGNRVEVACNANKFKGPARSRRTSGRRGRHKK